MPRFRDARAFGQTLDAAAEQLGISATAVEKDYWVSQVLQGLATDHRDTFVFKGGTSLSKAHGIVQRFSEDIDVLVLPGDRGRGSTDELMKSLGQVAATSIGGSADAWGHAETGLHRAFTIHYPATRPATELLATSVLLEMGVRGGPHPHELMPIGSLLGDALAAAGRTSRSSPISRPSKCTFSTPEEPSSRSSCSSTASRSSWPRTQAASRTVALDATSTTSTNCSLIVA